MQEIKSLVLEIIRHNSQLSMSLYESHQPTSTIKHYSQCSVDFGEVDKLCQQMTLVINRIYKKQFEQPELINELKKIGQVLWDHLLTRSVKDRLNSTNIKNLVLSLDEELIYIPWELLYNSEEFLCLKFNLGRLVRAKDYLGPVKYRSQTLPLKMLVLSNPTGDLDSAYREGLFIKNQFDLRRSQVKIDFKSTSIDILYLKKNLRDYDIVHFAGHCQYDRDDPQMSGWVLSDGRFTIKDVLSLGQSPYLPILVFSNACQSAQVQEFNLMDLDYQQKSYSLASAFLFSGVRHYIGSICKVEDTVSLAFAEEFYSRLLESKPVGECVRLARMQLVKRYGLDNMYWISYLLYGDPNFSLFGLTSRPQVETLRPKRDISVYKRVTLRLALLIAVLTLVFGFYCWLPTLNPNTYILFAKAKRLFSKGKNQEVIAICSQIARKEPLFLEVHHLLGETYQRMGKRKEALRYYFDYALFSERRQDLKSLACAYIDIAWVYQNLGEYPKAFEFYNKAVNLSRQNRDKLNEAFALRRLAVWYIDKQDYTQALELLTKSSEINRCGQNSYRYRYNLACDYFDLGLLFTEKDDFVTAKEFYQKSRALFERLDLKGELSDYYFNLGEIYLFEKQYQKALDCYLRGLKIDQLHGDQPNIASDYNMLGELYFQMDNFIEAERFFNQAVVISKQIDGPLELASSYYNLGLLYKQQGKSNRAKEYLRLAQEIYSKIDTPHYQQIKQEILQLD
ncbi:MAG: tetratricopeptide repeat protein [Candidatus Omnitrophica bacterium]|nr:tetratricopeptide repeat protein [Candidatus Omnitrophota bacterium]